MKTNISIPKKLIDLYISYILDPQLRNWNTDFTLSNCLFVSAKLTIDANVDKDKYNGYGIVFDFLSEFSFTDGCYGKNAIMFGADTSSSVHIDNKEKIT